MKGTKGIIGVKDAVLRAMDHFRMLYDEPKFEPLLLEEAEISEDHSHWLITLSYVDATRSPGEVFFAPSKRAYKQFTIDAETGDVLAMKIRTVS